MSAAVDVQQHSGHGPPQSPSVMRAAFAPARHQTGALQGLLYPAIAQLDVFRLLQFFVKVPYVEVRILVLVQRQHFSAVCMGTR